MKPLVSVIIPVYKTGKYLKACMNCVLNQTYKNLEVILVDDGSPDNSGALCDEFAEKDKRIKVIHQENKGLSCARNTGIDNATGDIISFIDSDDCIDLKMYEIMVKYMEQNKLDVVCCDTNIIKGYRKKFKPRYAENKIFNGNEGLNEILNGALDNSACNKIYKKECIGDIRFPVGRIFEDVATVYLFLSKAKRVGYLAMGLYDYYKRAEGIIGSSFNSKSRYECFIGYKERLEYAVEHKLACIEACRKNTVETSLATLTAFYATNESSDSPRFREVTAFIAEQGKLLKSKLKPKQRILLWSFYNMQALHKTYAKLSAMSKK